jgi:SAM-dependent methyltransferase
MSNPVFTNYGYCHCCDQAVKFIATDSWFRDYYVCSECDSIPRERALSWAIDNFFPDWRQVTIHESSPIPRGASEKLRRHCHDYITSQYFPGVESGAEFQGWRCEDLENLSFADNSIDLHVSQDVMEHILSPDRVFQEIARTLRPGGMHIFTVPLVNKTGASEICAERGEEGEIRHLLEPEYHGNPVSDQGSLVTRRWGYDICEYIFRSSGLFTRIIYMDALEWGIRAEFIEVLVTMKPQVAVAGPDLVSTLTEPLETAGGGLFSRLRKKIRGRRK